MIQTALLNCIRAMGGYALEGNAQIAFDTDTFKEQAFLANLKARGADVPAAMNWYEQFILHSDSRLTIGGYQVQCF